VKTGVQEICNALKKLDSGFRRNDKLKTNPIFSHLWGRREGIFLRRSLKPAGLLDFEILCGLCPLGGDYLLMKADPRFPAPDLRFRL
jgi:hypothetical protein